MKLKSILLFLLLPVLMLLVVTCAVSTTDSSPEHDVQTPTPMMQVDIFDLTQDITPISHVYGQVGDRIEVAIELHQKYTPAVGLPCAEEGVFLVDGFGNMTELAYKEKDGARKQDKKLGTVTTFSYGMAFHPAADGEYKIYVGDAYCSVRKDGLSATVHWDIYRQ